MVSLIPCPDCGLPRAAADIDSSPCPVCGWQGPELVLAEADSPPAPPPPAPEPEPGQTRNWVLLGAVCAAGAGVVAAMFAVPYIGRLPGPSAGVAVVSPPTPVPARPGPELAPAPRFVPELAPQPRPAPDLVQVDMPDGPFKLDRLTGGKKVRLVGEAQSLIVAGLDGGAVLDASGLTVRDVLFTGPVGGGSTAVVRTATDGGVLFRAGVDGRSRVTVETGFVAFLDTPGKSRQAARVAGGSRLEVAARGAYFGGPISGAGTRVEVTLRPPGRLEFTAVDAAAELVYRTAGPADPPPVVTRGQVRGQAVVKLEK
jgi:hypothetical protein